MGKQIPFHLCRVQWVWTLLGGRRRTTYYVILVESCFLILRVGRTSNTPQPSPCYGTLSTLSLEASISIFCWCSLYDVFVGFGSHAMHCEHKELPCVILAFKAHRVEVEPCRTVVYLISQTCILRLLEILTVDFNTTELNLYLLTCRYVHNIL